MSTPLVHAAWRDDRALCSFLPLQLTTFIDRDVTCADCRELRAQDVAAICGISVDDVKRATWPETFSASGGPRGPVGPPASAEAGIAGVVPLHSTRRA